MNRFVFIALFSPILLGQTVAAFTTDPGGDIPQEYIQWTRWGYAQGVYLTPITKETYDNWHPEYPCMYEENAWIDVYYLNAQYKTDVFGVTCRPFSILGACHKLNVLTIRNRIRKPAFTFNGNGQYLGFCRNAVVYKMAPGWFAQATLTKGSEIDIKVTEGWSESNSESRTDSASVTISGTIGMEQVSSLSASAEFKTVMSSSHTSTSFGSKETTQSFSFDDTTTSLNKLWTFSAEFTPKGGGNSMDEGNNLEAGTLTLHVPEIARTRVDEMPQCYPGTNIDAFYQQCQSSSDHVTPNETREIHLGMRVDRSRYFVAVGLMTGAIVSFWVKRRENKRNSEKAALENPLLH